MDIEWMNDARKIPGWVMDYFRKTAVRAIVENGHSPEDVADIFHISRTAVYAWVRRYEAGGYAELDTKAAPGAEPKITAEMDEWLHDTVLKSTPNDFGYETVLWTQKILAEILAETFDVDVGDSTIGYHLRGLGLSYQKPWFRAEEQDPVEVDRFLHDKFPRILRLADRIGADIGFEDESGFCMGTHSGRTWGEIGNTPEIPITSMRGGCNVLSTVTPQGELHFSIKERHINSEQYIDFLKDIIRGRDHPMILLVDKASFHHSKDVRTFVRAHRDKIRIFFFPGYSPEMNPDEQVWNTIKSKKLNKMTIKTKDEFKKAIRSALRKLQRDTELILSFFQLPDTKYAAIC
jgi:transposase